MAELRYTLTLSETERQQLNELARMVGEADGSFIGEHADTARWLRDALGVTPDEPSEGDLVRITRTLFGHEQLIGSTGRLMAIDTSGQAPVYLVAPRRGPYYWVHEVEVVSRG